MESVYTVKVVGADGQDLLVFDMVLPDNEPERIVESINASQFHDAVSDRVLHAGLDWFAHPWPTITIAPDPLI